MKEQIAPAALLLNLPPNIVEDVAMSQFFFLREFFENPPYAGIYLKHLGTWHTQPYSLIKAVSNHIKAYRKTRKQSTLKLIQHLFQLRHKVREYKLRSIQPNQSRAYMRPTPSTGHYIPSTKYKRTPWQ